MKSLRISCQLFLYHTTLKVAVETIEDFLLEHDMEVTLVIFDQETWYLAKEKFGELMDTIHIGKETYYDQ